MSENLPRVIKVIESHELRGAGNQANPHRSVKQYHTLKGKFLADKDDFELQRAKDNQEVVRLQAKKIKELTKQNRQDIDELYRKAEFGREAYKFLKDWAASSVVKKSKTFQAELKGLLDEWAGFE